MPRARLSPSRELLKHRPAALSVLQLSLNRLVLDAPKHQLRIELERTCISAAGGNSIDEDMSDEEGLSTFVVGFGKMRDRQAALG